MPRPNMTLQVRHSILEQAPEHLTTVTLCCVNAWSGDGRDNGEKVESGESVELSLTARCEEDVELSTFHIGDEDDESISPLLFSRDLDQVGSQSRRLGLMGAVWPRRDS